MVHRLTELITPIIDEFNFELVEMRLAGGAGHPLVRAFIDKAGGITVDDCSAVSRRFSLELDHAELFASSHTLEVSSPGLDRPLVNRADFNRRRGHQVRLCLRDSQKPMIGTIVSTDRELVLQTATGRAEVAFERIKQGLLEF